MIDYYKELEIEKAWELSEIQNYLDKHYPKWEGLAINRGDSKSIQILEYAKQAKKIFENHLTRIEYDNDLDLFLNPPSQLDLRSEACLDDLKRAEEAYERQDYNLAKIAIQASFKNRESGVIAPLQLAATVSLSLKEFSQALEYINQAIYEVSDDKHNYYLKLDIMVEECVFLSKNQLANHQELSKKRETAFNYLSKYFEQDISPQTSKEKVQLYELQLKQNKLLNYDSSYQFSFRDRVFNEYRELVLQLNDGNLYKNIYDAYRKYYSDGYLYETSSELLSFSNSILKNRPNEGTAVSFIERYNEIRKYEEEEKRKEEEERRQKEEERRKQEEERKLLVKNICSLDASINEKSSLVSVLYSELEQIKLKRQLISVIFDIGCLIIPLLLVFHSIVYTVIFVITSDKYGQNLKTIFTIEIVIYLLIESFILLTNFVKEYRIFNLKEKISDTEDEISKMKNDLQNMRIQLNSIPNTDSIPYTDSMASYTIVGENYY